MDAVRLSASVVLRVAAASVPLFALKMAGKTGSARVKNDIPPLLLRLGPLTLDQLGAELGGPHERTLRSWLCDLRNEGRVHQVYAGRSDRNGRIYSYEIGPSSKPLPTMRATEYRHAAPTGSDPDRVRRLMQPE
jgi:hypothetical protein